MTNSITVGEWVDTGDGYREKTIKRDNVTIVVRRPTTLTEKERQKREHAVEHALAQLARAMNH